MKGGAGVRLQCTDGVARVTLDRPGRLNAVDAATDAALDEIWTALEGDPAVRCVVLTGSGRAFCAGADLKEDGPDGLAYWAGTGRHGFGGIALGGRLSVPVIARVNGLALGGGFEMALGCDLIVATESASFGLPEPRVGRLPLDAMVTLPRRLPRALALGLLLTGRRIGAAEALAHGLVNQTAPDETLLRLDGRPPCRTLRRTLPPRATPRRRRPSGSPRTPRGSPACRMRCG